MKEENLRVATTFVYTCSVIYTLQYNTNCQNLFSETGNNSLGSLLAEKSVEKVCLLDLTEQM